MTICRWQIDSTPPIEEQQPRPTDGRSLPLEYPAGEIAVRVQARREKSDQRAD